MKSNFNNISKWFTSTVFFLVMPLLAQAQTLKNPIKNITGDGEVTLVGFATFIYTNILGLLTFLIFLALVWAGLQFVLALGKPDDLKKARRNLLNVLIGGIIILLAGALIQLLGSTISQLIAG